MKRIIVACDGTGQSANRGDYSVSTNINRICHALKIDGPVQQLVYYQSGIGTSNYGAAFTKFARTFNLFPALLTSPKVYCRGHWGGHR